MSFPDPGFRPPPPPPIPPAYPPGNPHQTAIVLAVLSVVLGAGGFLSNLPCVGCFLMWMPPLAIVLGIIALTQNPDSTGKTLAIVGIVCGALSIVLWVAMIVLGVGSALLNNPQIRPEP